VSDPGGGWAGDPLRDGLILTVCNTGLVVNPNGTGTQLRGGTVPSPWGGSVYGWTVTASLPA
jgi:hypothetical protein